jgi:hypothetical protein
MVKAHYTGTTFGKSMDLQLVTICSRSLNLCDKVLTILKKEFVRIDLLQEGF